MTCSFSLSHLTLLSCTPPETVEIAARCGYRFVGVRLLPSGPGGLAYPLMSDRTMMRDTLSRMSDTGIGVFDIESVCLQPETSPETYRPMFEAGAQLGARTVLVSAFDDDPVRLADNFEALCDVADGYGLMCHLEFIPWSAVRTPLEARRMVEGSRRPNAHVLLDALHLDRSGEAAADLLGLRGAMQYFHLCDASPYRGGGDDELLHTARFARLLPGEGTIDLRQIIEAAPTDAVIGVEVPSEEMLRRLGAQELARRALLAAKSVVERCTGPIDA